MVVKSRDQLIFEVEILADMPGELLTYGCKSFEDPLLSHQPNPSFDLRAVSPDRLPSSATILAIPKIRQWPKRRR